MKNQLKGFGLGLGTKMVTLMGKTWVQKGRPIKIRTADEYGPYVIRVLPKKAKPEKILILQDPDMALVRSLINKRDGIEAANKAVWVTADTVDKFEKYSKAKTNFRAANSTGRLIDLYQRDLKDLASDSEVNEYEYARVYIPFPEVATDDDKTKVQEQTSTEEEMAHVDASEAKAKVEEVKAAGVSEEKKVQEKVDAAAVVCDEEVKEANDDDKMKVKEKTSEELIAAGVFVDVSEATKVHEKVEAADAVCDEKGVDKQKQEDPVKKKNVELLEDLLRNSAALIKKGGIIKVLQFPRLPYSSWNIHEIAKKCGLKLDSTKEYDSQMFKGFSPRKAGSDEKFSPNGSVIYSYRRLSGNVYYYDNFIRKGRGFCLIFEDAMGLVDVLKF
ncbi:hypothetical protein CTI12_AA604520 [Artemisia annua]|uniref:25S rRNA (uridine-N(3))-methyltransferase BMT5-like domain-containing protein n=1 Tax=Artemisia annua TaxID=35608 RepID=A0A2U1KGR4_ARTAN|nr:hypothetical protein CTI12_AA604520 [Artemisia annua]